MTTQIRGLNQAIRNAGGELVYDERIPAAVGEEVAAAEG